jgi:hypothetical protein
MGDGDHATAYYVDRNRFIKPYLSKSYIGDTLHVTTLHEVNSCARTIGKVKFSNDTLYLLTERQGDVVCTSVEFRKFSYTIKRNEIDKFQIVY